MWIQTSNVFRPHIISQKLLKGEHFFHTLRKAHGLNFENGVITFNEVSEAINYISNTKKKVYVIVVLFIAEVTDLLFKLPSPTKRGPNEKIKLYL